MCVRLHWECLVLLPAGRACQCGSNLLGWQCCMLNRRASCGMIWSLSQSVTSDGTGRSLVGLHELVVCGCDRRQHWLVACMALLPTDTVVTTHGREATSTEYRTIMYPQIVWMVPWQQHRSLATEKSAMM